MIDVSLFVCFCGGRAGFFADMLNHRGSGVNFVN